MRNRTKQLLKEGKTTIGCWVGIPHSDVVEIIANAGFDWIVFDMEHCPLTIQDVQKMMPSVNDAYCTPIIRVAWNDPVLIKLALDVGVQGVVVPFVNTRQEAVNAVRACKYPPSGIRGVYPRRASSYLMNFDEYIASADKEIMIIPQIETVEAVKNVEEILSTEGIDTFLVGPMDLSASFGLLDIGPKHPSVAEAIDKVLDAGRKAKIPAGIWGGNIDNVNKYIEQGFQFLALYADTDLLVRAKDDLARIRRVL